MFFIFVNANLKYTDRFFMNRLNSFRKMNVDAVGNFISGLKKDIQAVNKLFVPYRVGDKQPSCRFHFLSIK